MNGIEIVVTTSAGLNVFILGAVILNAYRVGKIEGTLKNSNYLHCPFYKGHINKEVRTRQRSGKDSS